MVNKLIAVCGWLLALGSFGYGQEQRSALKENTGEARIFSLPGGARLEMVWIAPGTFTLGSPELESPLQIGRSFLIFENEQPAQEATISEGVWLENYELSTCFSIPLATPSSSLVAVI